MKQDLRAKVASVNLSSLQKLKSPQLLLTLIVFCFGLSLNFQSGIKINTSQAYYFGFLTDYFILTIHPSDILIILMALFSLKNFKFKKNLKIQKFVYLLFLTTLIALWFIFSPNKTLLVFGLIKLIFVSLLIFSIFNLTTNSKTLYLFIKIFSIGLISGAVISTFIGLIQFSTGISPNIPIIGSYRFFSTTPNIASGLIFNNSFLRAYGTTPHPNILAALLVSALAYSIFIINSAKTKYLKFLCSLLVGIFTIGLVGSFSRTGIIMAIILVLLRYKNNLPINYKFIILFIPSFILFSLFYISGISIESKTISERLELNLIGLKVFFDNLIIGVGPNNYLIVAQNYFFQNFNLRLFQPPHNFLILFLAEYGIIGLILVLLFFKQTIGKFVKSQPQIKSHLLLPLVGAYGFGMIFDHYFLTQFQTNYIFAVLIGLILATNKMLDLK